MIETNHAKVLDKLVIVAHAHKKEENYWLKKLSDHQEKNMFPYDYKLITRDEKKDKSVFTVLQFRFPGEVAQKLIGLANQSDPRLHIILAAGLTVLLSKYSNSNDIIIGTPIYKQEQEGTFINTVVPLRNFISDRMTFREFVLEARETVTGAISHQSYPFEVLLDKLNMPLPNPGDDCPLFDTALLVESIHNRDYIRHIHVNTIFIFRCTGEYIEGLLEYNSGRYRETSIERIVRHFETLLAQVLSNVDIRIADIDILSIKEKEQLLVEFNATGAEYPKEKTIQQLFEEQVEKTFHHTALVFEENQLTYGELNKKANQLARILITKRIGPNTITAVMLERSMEMIAVLLGILKAGSAYLPLDTDIPLKRLTATLEDSEAPVLVTNTAVVGKSTFQAVQTSLAAPKKPYITARRPQITDLESIPIPDRSLVDYEKYNRYIGQAYMANCISLQATRGCPYNCAYCHKIWPKKHVVRSAEHIFSEVKLLYDMGVRRFSLIDDIFNLDRKNSMKFFQLIIENDLNLQISFPNGMRGDILTKEYIDLMVKTGVIEVALALETASPRIQKLIRKNLDLETFRENLEYFCEKYPQVLIRLYTMVGFPSETKEEAMKTLNFIKSLKWLHFPYLFILKIFPKTDMEKIAIENGISQEAIAQSLNLAYHELPSTLPFEKSFVLQYQADFFNNYFLSKERLLHVLPYHFRQYSEAELMQIYNAYLPIDIGSLDKLLEFFGITREEPGITKCLDPDYMKVPDLNKKLANHFKSQEPNADALRILLLDLSIVFSGKKDIFANTNEPPLGLMYLLTYLYHRQGSLVHGKIGKSRMDFDNYKDLKTFIREFNPDVIGIRTLSMYCEFFHQAVAMIRQWGIDIPIVAGGPYATSSFEMIIQDANIDVVVIGEGEITFNQLIEKIRENNKKLPGEEVLKNIEGIAFNPANLGAKKMKRRQTVFLDAITEQLAQQPHHNLPHVNHPKDPAYVIYTSGTTGNPKGVIVEHRNVVRLMFNNKYLFDFSSRDVWTMCHAYNFDFSVWEMYGALLYGGKLLVIPKLLLIDTEKFPGILEKENITVFNQTPSAFFNLLEELSRIKRNIKIKYLIFGGEALTPLKLKEWQQAYPDIKIINMFGITETTVHVTFKEIHREEILLNISNIGKPIPTLTVYVMDNHLELTPVGAVGEICVGGEGLAKGYLNRPQLTGEKFVDNPYNKRERLYRSGDLGRISETGEIEYLGRIDQQVKVRGFRIEPGEIEKQLMQHPWIKDVVVVPREDATHSKYLVAYLVGKRSNPNEPQIRPSNNTEKETAVSVTSRELRQFLEQRLPAYMIPTYFVPLVRMPLTSTGKIDYKAFPEPKARQENGYVAPRNDIERKLAEIWAEVLGIGQEVIGIDSNFFDLGGHSLKATVLATRLHKTFTVKFSLAEIFTTPTIRGMTHNLEGVETDPYTSIEPVEEKEYYPLSSAQMRLYILKQMNPGDISYNMTEVLAIEGRLDKEKLEKTFIKLIERHECLRTSFEVRGEMPAQKIHGPDEIEFSTGYEESDEEGARVIIKRFIKPFDFTRPPLLRVLFIKIADPKHIVILEMPHIIADAVSVQIFVKEFMGLYEGKELPSLKLQYKDYTEWQQCSIKNEIFKAQENYWRKQFEKKISPLNMPYDYENPGIQDIEGNSAQFFIDAEETAALKKQASSREVTWFMMFLAIYNVFLSKICQQEDIVIGTPTAKRTHNDFYPILGLFADTLLLRNHPRGEKTFTEFLREVKERTLEAFENQDYPYMEMVEKLALHQHRNYTRDAIFNVQFQFENVEIPGVEIPGLKLRPYDAGKRTAKLDLLLIGIEIGDRIRFIFNYKTKLFKEETINKFTGYFKRIVSAVAQNPQQKLSQIVIIPGEKRKERMTQFNVELEDE